MVADLVDVLTPADAGNGRDRVVTPKHLRLAENESRVYGARLGASKGVEVAYLTQVPQRELIERSGRREDTPDNRHRDVMSLFGSLPGVPRKDAGILFRLERLPGREPTYLVRSRVPVAHPTSTTKSRIELNDVPPVGSNIAFRVSVNAVQRPKSGKTRPVAPDRGDVDDGDCGSDGADKPASPTVTPWLMERFRGAMSELTVLNHTREVLGTTRYGAKPDANKVIQVDIIDGVAKVADVGILAQLLAEGVGRERAYGCGLLTIKRLT